MKLNWARASTLIWGDDITSAGIHGAHAAHLSNECEKLKEKLDRRLKWAIATRHAFPNLPEIVRPEICCIHYFEEIGRAFVMRYLPWRHGWLVNFEGTPPPAPPQPKGVSDKRKKGPDGAAEMIASARRACRDSKAMLERILCRTYDTYVRPRFGQILHIFDDTLRMMRNARENAGTRMAALHDVVSARRAEFAAVIKDLQKEFTEAAAQQRRAVAHLDRTRVKLGSFEFDISVFYKRDRIGMLGCLAGPRKI